MEVWGRGGIAGVRDPIPVTSVLDMAGFWVSSMLVSRYLRVEIARPPPTLHLSLRALLRLRDWKCDIEDGDSNR